MSPAERLRAAADRLETLDREAIPGPWTACGCPLPVEGRIHGSTCRHFSDALALPDAILGGVS